MGQPEGPAYLELYKLAVEMADRVSARRTAANSFFLTVQTALVALLGVDDISDEAVAGAGLVLAGAWWALLRSYRKLNQAKYEVICELEKRLPVQMLTDEWQRLKGNRYAELSIVEQLVPVVFASIYVVVLVSS